MKSFYIDKAVERAEKAEGELKRLRQDYPGGDQEAQAMAWSAVYQLCTDLGMSLNHPELVTGRVRVLEFIRSLHEKAHAKPDAARCAP